MSQPTIVNIAPAARLHEAGFRYRRPVVQVVHESFKGQTTKLTNLEQICKSLQVPPAEFVPAFLKNVKKVMGISMSKASVFPGHLASDAFDKVLQTMIERHILCPRPACRLPEWDGQTCRACGHDVSESKESKESTKHPKAKEQAAEAVAHSLTEVQETSEACTRWETEQSNRMHQLYDLRLSSTDPVVQKQCDQWLDAAWHVHTERDWKKLESNIRKQCPVVMKS